MASDEMQKEARSLLSTLWYRFPFDLPSRSRLRSEFHLRGRSSHVWVSVSVKVTPQGVTLWVRTFSFSILRNNEPSLARNSNWSELSSSTCCLHWSNWSRKCTIVDRNLVLTLEFIHFTSIYNWNHRSRQCEGKSGERRNKKNVTHTERLLFCLSLASVTRLTFDKTGTSFSPS
jgi:hypothetical protein